MPAAQDVITELQELARRKSWANLDKAWAEMAIDPIVDPRFYTQWCQMLAKLRHVGPLEEMIRQVAANLNDAGKHVEASRILRAVLRVAPHLSGLREPLIASLVGAYGDRNRFDECLAASGLESAESLGKALIMFELMLTSTPGSVFRHKTWGVGVVREQNLDDRSIVVDFPDRPNQSISFSGIREFLERIPPTHILARIATEPDELRSDLKSDPAEHVKHALRNHGGEMKQGDLKALFVPTIFTTGQWSRWWTSARDALRLDAYVDLQGTGAHCRITLRQEPRSVVEDVLTRFEDAGSHHARHQAVRETVRFLKSKGLAPEQLGPVSDFLKRGADEAATPSDRLGWALLAAELADAVEGEAPIWRPDIPAMLSELGADADLIRGLDLSDHQARALQISLERDRGHFAEMCVGLVDEVPLTLTKWIMRTLLEDPSTRQQASDALDQLLHEPQAHPEGYVWALEEVIRDPEGLGSLRAAKNHVAVVTRVFDFLDEAQRRIDNEDPDANRLRSLAGKFRNALEADRHEVLAWVFQNLSTEDARSLYQRMLAMPSLSDAWKNEAAASIKTHRTDLEEHGPIERADDILLVTEGAIKEKTTELQDIRTRQIPENSKEIEVAREHGDLRENAEYKAAKERQVILHRRAEELQDLLGKARPIMPDLIDTSTVTPGTRVHLRNNATGEEARYTLLGLWDAKPDEGIISYKSPLGSQLLRRTHGEIFTVTLPSGEEIEYEVLGIERAI